MFVHCKKQYTILQMWAVMLASLACYNTGIAASSYSAALKDLFYGEALYHAYLDDYFSAIIRLDTELIQHYQLDEPERDALLTHRSAAEFSVGDLELSYRMHRQAGRALERLFHESIDQQTQNIAAYKMAHIFFQKRYFVNSLHALDLIRGEVPKTLEEDAIMLRAQAEMMQLNFEKAIGLLKRIRKSQNHEGYAAYNLAVAHIRNGELGKGVALLDQVGSLISHERELLSLRDKANLTLGYSLLEQAYAKEARPYFERVRLRGPFSNKALLWAGWADAAQERYENALVPWSLLNERDPTDSAVQEALLALPYAYSKLQAYGKAAVLYGKAVTEFNREIDHLDSSINSIMQGKLLKALVEKDDEQNSSFLARLKKQDDAPETRYLLELLAGHDFQESVKNYRDLAFLKRNIEQWQRNITAYQDIIKLRRQYYEPLLPSIEEKFSVEAAHIQQVLEKYDYYSNQLKTIARLRDPKALATSSELKLERLLSKLESRLQQLSPHAGTRAALLRVERMKGALYWNIYTQFEERLDRAYHNLADLEHSIEDLKRREASVIRFKREAYQSYEGYEMPFRRLDTRLSELKRHLVATQEQQGRYLEKRAVLELDQRRKKLADYQVKARFALAESYDRAIQKQKQNDNELIQQNPQESESEEGEPLESKGSRS